MFEYTDAKAIFGNFLPEYVEEIQNFLMDYKKLFPKHIRDYVVRHEFNMLVGLFKDITADWLERGMLEISQDATCDVLIGM